MIKKIRLLSMSFVIFWLWFSFANPLIPEGSYFLYTPDKCNKLENVVIDNYKVVILPSDQFRKDFLDWLPNPNNSDGKRKFYAPKANVCIEKWGAVFLVDKSIKIKNITPNNVIDAWSIATSNCTSDCDEIRIYRIINDWKGYKIWHSESQRKDSWETLDASSTQWWKDLSNFLIAWLMAIIIETIILFGIAKLFRKKEQISNWKLILFWILPTTITLPFLRFVLPLIIWEWIWYTIVWEILVIMIETIILKYWLKISRWKSMIVSVVCNVASYGAWLLIL